MNNILDQIAEEIKILQNIPLHYEDKNISDFHKKTLDQISEEIKILQNL